MLADFAVEEGEAGVCCVADQGCGEEEEKEEVVLIAVANAVVDKYTMVVKF